MTRSVIWKQNATVTEATHSRKRTKWNHSIARICILCEGGKYIYAILLYKNCWQETTKNIRTKIRRS